MVVPLLQFFLVYVKWKTGINDCVMKYPLNLFLELFSQIKMYDWKRWYCGLACTARIFYWIHKYAVPATHTVFLKAPYGITF